MSTDPTTDPRRVFQLVDKREGTPASGTFDSRADALAWLDPCPHGWPRVLFDIKESHQRSILPPKDLAR